MTAVDLLRTVIAVEQDVFAARQRVRELAEALGMESQDQVRLATALSEVGRLMLAHLGTVELVFRFEPGSPALLSVEASASAPESGPRRTVGVAGAELPDFVAELKPLRRLMDRWRVATREGRLAVTMARRLPASRSSPTDADLSSVRESVAALVPMTPLQELAVQNRNLLASLEQIQAQRDDLLRLNAELEETNGGVMALYNQLSDEMEATNRGVVALYAELDAKSAQLRDASEAKSRFLANVSHELRAPATAVIGLLRLLLDPRSDPLTSEQRHQLSLIQRSANDMLGLVNELLDLAKAESGRVEPEWQDVDLVALFHTLRGTMQPLIDKPDLALVVDEPPPQSTIRTDETLLSQVLRNLLTNAIKFTTHGEVRLVARHSDDGTQLDLIVSDTGIGIAPAEQERVFEEFYQVRGAGQPVVKGTGLGLPYARRVTTLLGGSLTLASTPGQGSTFTVSLPIQPSAAQTQTREPRVILVVEGDVAFRQAVVTTLSDPWTRVVAANDGQEAIAAIDAERPDVVVLDMRLPEIDGAAVLNHLTTDEFKRIPVIVLTAFTQDVAHSAALPRVSAVLGKAANTLDHLPTLVRTALRGAGR